MKQLCFNFRRIDDPLAIRQAARESENNLADHESAAATHVPESLQAGVLPVHARLQPQQPSEPARG